MRESRQFAGSAAGGTGRYARASGGPALSVQAFAFSETSPEAGSSPVQALMVNVDGQSVMKFLQNYIGKLQRCCEAC